MPTESGNETEEEYVERLANKIIIIFYSFGLLPRDITKNINNIKDVKAEIVELLRNNI